MAEDTTGEENESTEENLEESHSYLNQLEHRVGELMHSIPESVHEVFRRHRRSAFEKHPFFFSTLGLLGVVATWQGFDDIIERVEFFDANPGSLLIIGLIILLLTGRLYRQMDR